MFNLFWSPIFRSSIFSRPDKVYTVAVRTLAYKAQYRTSAYVTCDRLVSSVEALRRQPLDHEDGGTGGVYAEDEDETPGRVVVRLCRRQTLIQYVIITIIIDLLNKRTDRPLTLMCMK